MCLKTFFFLQKVTSIIHIFYYFISFVEICFSFVNHMDEHPVATCDTSICCIASSSFFFSFIFLIFTFLFHFVEQKFIPKDNTQRLYIVNDTDRNNSKLFSVEQKDWYDIWLQVFNWQSSMRYQTYHKLAWRLSLSSKPKIIYDRNAINDCRTYNFNVKRKQTTCALGFAKVNNKTIKEI